MTSAKFTVAKAIMVMSMKKWLVKSRLPPVAALMIASMYALLLGGKVVIGGLTKRLRAHSNKEMGGKQAEKHQNRI